MRIIIASDSFKGGLSSAEAAMHIAEGIRRILPDAVIDVVPIADGGEGTTIALTEALGGELQTITVTGPMADPVQAVIGILPGGEAVVDMASASGLTLVPPGKTDVLSATTYGTGQLLMAALERGARRIYMGIGGSATNDGGLGMAQALGVRFLDGDGNPLGWRRDSLSPDYYLSGGYLMEVASIDLSGVDARLAGAEILVLCDVSNPLCGPTGASYIYGPQKGAGAAEKAILDKGLAHLAQIVRRDLNMDLAEIPGAGAAGGLGFGLMAFTGASLQPGVDIILDASGFDDKANEADLIITGEGRLDHQSAFGKTPAGIARRGMALGVPVIAIGGAIEGNLEALYEAGVGAVEAGASYPMPLSEAIEKAPALIADAAERIMRSIMLGMRMRK